MSNESSINEEEVERHVARILKMPPPTIEEIEDLRVRMRRQRIDLRASPLGQYLNPDVDEGADGTAETERKLLEAESFAALDQTLSGTRLSLRILAAMC